MFQNLLAANYLIKERLPFRRDVVRNWKSQNFLQKATNLNQLSIKIDNALPKYTQ